MNNGSVCVFLGMWLFLSGFAKDLTTPLNLTISGIAAICIGLYGLLFLKRKRALIPGLLGLWLVVNSIVFGNSAAFNFILIGFIIGILGFSCICRGEDEKYQSSRSIKEQIRNCFKFYKN